MLSNTTAPSAEACPYRLESALVRQPATKGSPKVEASSPTGAQVRFSKLFVYAVKWLAMLRVISLASPPSRDSPGGRTTTSTTTPNRPRVAASSYLNTAPLIWSFQYGTGCGAVELITDAAPAYCGDLLSRGEVEAALVPIIEYQRMEDARIFPEVCVGSRRAVRSVVLVSRHADLKDVRRVALDESSRTSQALVKIIFREFLNSEPACETNAPDITALMEGNDAALVIGDPAMRIGTKEFHVFDLAALWNKFTNTGFVFAMWMARAATAEAVNKVDFAGARDEGLGRIDEIIAQYESEVLLPPAEIREYLTDNITFTVDENLERGMRLYFELAHKHGLIERNKPLQFTT